MGRILIGKVKRWLLCSRWRKAQWCALEVIKLKNKIIYRREALVCIQKNLRMYLARKQHRPRYLGLQTIKMLSGQVDKIQELGRNLKGGKSSMEQNMDKAVGTIKACEKIKKAEIDKMYNSLVEQIKKEFGNVKKKLEEERIAEEEERLRKLQEEMER